MGEPRMEKASGLVISVVYINVILYSLCYQLQSPVEPYMVERLVQGNNDAGAYSRVQAWFSVIQTAGSLVVGLLLDRFGLRGAFVINFMSAAMAYGILANATTMELLYLSKLPTLCMHGFLCAQATISKCTEEGKSRVAALGRLTACYTVGATLGPALGGWLGANVDHYFGAKLAVAGSLLSALLSYLFIPSQMRVESPKGGALEGSGSRPGLMVQMRSVVAPTADVLAIKVFTGMANSMLSTAMPLILKDTFAFKEDQMGLAQSAMTFLTAICNAFFLGPLVAMCGSLVAVIRLCLIGTVAGLVGQALLISYQALTAEAFILCRMGLSLFQFILAGNLTAESTSRVSAELKGSLLGTEHALFSAVRVFSPTWSVSVLNSHGILGLTICSASIYAATTATWIFSGFVYGKVPGQQQDAVGHNALPAHKAGQEATQQEKKAR